MFGLSTTGNIIQMVTGIEVDNEDYFPK